MQSKLNLLILMNRNAIKWERYFSGFFNEDGHFQYDEIDEHIENKIWEFTKTVWISKKVEIKHIFES